MNPEDIVLSEISQTQRDKCYMIAPLRGIPSLAGFTGTESRGVFARVQEGEWGVGAQRVGSRFAR